MACTPDGFALGAMLLFEAVDGNDVPLLVLAQLDYPAKVFGITGETVAQMDNILY